MTMAMTIPSADKSAPDAVAVLERAAVHAPDSKVIQSHLQAALLAASQARAAAAQAQARLAVPPAAKVQPTAAGEARPQL